MRTLISALSLHKSASRGLGGAALVLIFSAVCHLVVLLAVSRQWAGPVSLRKPITFGISVGMLLWTVGWVIDRLPSVPRLEKSLGLSMLLSGFAEVALITVQAWRGVPSHFNYTTATDVAVFVAMGISIAVLSVCLVVATVWTFVSPPADRVVALAVRAGMVVVLTGLGIGQWIIELGNDFFEQFDRVPDKVLVGGAGVPTFPHAMGFHGIQVFIVAAVLTGLIGMQAAAAQRVLRLVVSGYAVLLLWAVVQAASGRGPVDLLWPGSALGLIAGGLLAAAAWQLFLGWRRYRMSGMSVQSPTSDLGAETAVPSAL